MGKVAVAGGSSGLGRTMVDALEAAKAHDYIILSRKATGPETRAVDYSDVNSLTSLLESEQVGTVISMLPIDNDESGQAQLNLIAAAERSTCTSVANNINNTYIGNMEASQYYCIAKWCILY
ncbi:hypothetical protein FOMA001_g1862 [Fusarium oxysporum f. sp. matthiolae]|nr:hypothetical protein FOMA001_g1862 [Fusarium oxysporum f. sp. matthiolae]